MQISFQPFIRKHSYLGLWYHIHGRLPVISFRALRPYLRVGLEEKSRTAYFFFFYKTICIWRTCTISFSYFLWLQAFWFMTRGSNLLNKMTAGALAKILLLTECPPEPLAQKQVNFTELSPMVSSSDFAQMVPLHWTMYPPKLQIINVFHDFSSWTNGPKCTLISQNCP